MYVTEHTFTCTVQAHDSIHYNIKAMNAIFLNLFTMLELLRSVHVQLTKPKKSESTLLILETQRTTVSPVKSWSIAVKRSFSMFQYLSIQTATVPARCPSACTCCILMIAQCSPKMVIKHLVTMFRPCWDLI